MTPEERDQYLARRKWGVAWTMETRPGAFNRDALEEKGMRGADALFTASVAYPENGALSIYFETLDGRTGEQMEDNEWFKVWMMLSKRLSESRTLEEGKREFAKITWEALRDIVLGGPCQNPGCAHGPGHKH